jgi:DNA-binding XRE family transcriptional regulator
MRRFSGSQLLKARNTAKLSRLDLAKAINFLAGTQSIISYEKGKTAPLFNTAIAMAEALNVPLKDLTEEVDAGS